MGGTVRIAAGAVLALLGLVLAVAGLAGLVLTRDGGLGGGTPATVRTDTYALVTDAGGLSGGPGTPRGTLVVRVTGSRPVFVGVAPAAAVDRWLSGAGYEQLTGVRLAPLEYGTARSAGTAAPGPPAAGPAWTAQDAGAGERTLRVPVAPGEPRRLVVANADGSPGVTVRASLQLRSPYLRRVAVGVLVGGALAAPLGMVLLATGVRRKVATRAR